jgi:2-polyprenyl-3-methyl-5-hydroxy-6-metoxy-1,4-benzoquinol methylase
VSSIPDSVFHSRAIRTKGVRIEDDPEPMVQQQLARLMFVSKQMELKGKRILEFGCGEGLNCAFLANQAAAICGFDVSEGSVRLAKEHYPQMPFLVADACDPGLDISAGSWDVVVSFEVLEHVPNMSAFLQNMRRHTKSDGVVFLSTPNRDIFSLGHEPSPINREHIKELNFDELQRLIRPVFPKMEIWGQRFKRPELLSAWSDDTRNKIAQLENGTRWKAQKPSLADNRLAKLLYKNGSVRAAWKYLRWDLMERVNRRRALAERPYGYEDFEFTKDLNGALWFCAIIRPN